MRSLQLAQLRTTNGGTDLPIPPKEFEPGGIFSWTTVFVPDPPVPGV